MKMIKISVLIPVYNAGKYLKECLDSVVKQTLNDIEVIAIDDGSTDESPQILDAYASMYPNVTVIHQKNMGVVATRCNLLMMAKGEYVAWIDSDDFMEPSMMEKMYQKAKSLNSDLILCDYSYYPEAVKTKEKWYKPYKGIVDWNFIERNTQQWNKIVKRSLLEEIGITDLMAKGGEGVYAFALIKAKKIASIDEELYNYRVGHTSLSSNKANVEWYKKNVVKTKSQLDAATDLNLSADLKTYFRYRYIYSWLQLMIIAAFNENEPVYEECRKQLRQLHWKQNPYTNTILANNYGNIKTFVFTRIIPMNYTIAKLIAKAAM